MRIIFIALFSFIMISCKKDDPTKIGYPSGMTVVDMQSTNDCTLAECSEERITRLIATNVEGKIVQDIFGQFAITYFLTFDSSVNFYLCDLAEEFQMDDLKVLYDGKALDACGVHEAIFPVEEVYILKITKIEKL